MTDSGRDYLIRVSWTDGLRQSKYFKDKFQAQDKIMELQRRGIQPRVDRVDPSELNEE